MERYCGWITDCASTCGSRLDRHGKLAAVLACVPCASSVVVRTSCSTHCLPLCSAVLAHWKRLSWPSAVKVNTRTSLSCTEPTPSRCFSEVPRALMMSSPSRAHRPLLVPMPRSPDFMRSCITCACWSPHGASVSPMITTPTISTATTPTAEPAMRNRDMPAARNAVSSPVPASPPRPSRPPISAALPNIS